MCAISLLRIQGHRRYKTGESCAWAFWMGLRKELNGARREAAAALKCPPLHPLPDGWRRQKKEQKQCQELKYREHDPTAQKNCSREDKEGATLKIIFASLISRWRLVTNDNGGSNTGKSQSSLSHDGTPWNNCCM